MPGLVIRFATFTLLYCLCGLIVAWLLYQQVLKSPAISEDGMPVEIGRGTAA